MVFLRASVIAWLVAAFLLLPSVGTRAAEAPDALQRPEVEKIIREYLLSHPEVVTEALQEAERREQEAQRKRAAEAIRSHEDNAHHQSNKQRPKDQRLPSRTLAIHPGNLQLAREPGARHRE